MSSVQVHGAIACFYFGSIPASDVCRAACFISDKVTYIAGAIDCSLSLIDFISYARVIALSVSTQESDAMKLHIDCLACLSVPTLPPTSSFVCAAGKES